MEYVAADYPEGKRWNGHGNPPPIWAAHDGDGIVCRSYMDYVDYLG